ncbi:DUF4190 domain-containing protein [Brevibacterium litoralis]|uniref:DUF4190 domain-containing protein n=1 Tax=Brevibacterium litoralis TaxID=3138935 RepID=UPI0032EB8AD6
MSDQYQPQQPQYTAPAGAPMAAQEDPGKTLGIVSLVASLATFIGFAVVGPIVGIITGHMARKKSREAGLEDNQLGKWGFILGIIFLILGIIGIVISVIVMIAAMGASAAAGTY